MKLTLKFRRQPADAGPARQTTFQPGQVTVEMLRDARIDAAAPRCSIHNDRRLFVPWPSSIGQDSASATAMRIAQKQPPDRGCISDIFNEKAMAETCG